LGFGTEKAWATVLGFRENDDPYEAMLGDLEVLRLRALEKEEELKKKISYIYEQK
jgi:hypothetical protein